MTAPVVASEGGMAPELSGQDVRQRAGGWVGGAAGVVGLWASSLLMLFYPWGTGRLWLRASLVRAIGVALMNSALGLLWLFVVVACAERCLEAQSRVQVKSAGGVKITWHQASLQAAATTVKAKVAEQWMTSALTEKVASVMGGPVMWAGLLLLPFFVILPFGVRPGRNSACVRHVARTVLLGTGAVHVWGAAFALVFTWLGATLPRSSGGMVAYDEMISPVMWIFTGLGFWTLAALVAVVRQEYRRAADLPQAHDPYCDDCGYILIAADAAGRCPECGRLVSDSLGPQARPPTPWEQRPSIFNWPVIRNQIVALVRRPRELFFSMPTLTGQRAAQRWLIGSMVVVALIASLIVPAIRWVITSELSGTTLSGALAMGLVWAVMALMMVGIETAGVAMFSRLKGHGVQLAAAAKVTAYSSSLMWPWVVLGGLQLLATVYWFYFNLTMVHKVSLRTEQVLLAGTIAAAHIGGLLHYELTVYRGVRAIQYANR